MIGLPIKIELIYTAKNVNAVNILQQTCYQQVDIRMRSHGVRLLVDDKSVASCQQTCCKVYCQNLLATGLLQVVSTSCDKFVSFSAVYCGFPPVG